MDDVIELIINKWGLIKEDKAQAFTVVFEGLFKQFDRCNEDDLESLIVNCEKTITQDSVLRQLADCHGDGFLRNIYLAIKTLFESAKALKNAPSHVQKWAIESALNQFFFTLFTLGVSIGPEFIDTLHKKLRLKFHNDKMALCSLAWFNEHTQCFNQLTEVYTLHSFNEKQEFDEFLTPEYPSLARFFHNNQSNDNPATEFKASLLACLTKQGTQPAALQAQAWLLKALLSSPCSVQHLSQCNLDLPQALELLDEQLEFCKQIHGNYPKALAKLFPQVDVRIKALHVKYGDEVTDEQLILDCEKQLWPDFFNALGADKTSVNFQRELLKLLFKPGSAYERPPHVEWLLSVIAPHKMTEAIDSYANRIITSRQRINHTHEEGFNLLASLEEQARGAGSLAEKLFLNNLCRTVSDFQKTQQLSEQYLSKGLSYLLTIVIASTSSAIFATAFSQEILLVYSLSILAQRSSNPVIRAIAQNTRMFAATSLVASFDLPLKIILTTQKSLSVGNNAIKALTAPDSHFHEIIMRDKKGHLVLHEYKHDLLKCIARPLEEYVRHIYEEQWFHNYRIGGDKAQKLSALIKTIRQQDLTTSLMPEKLATIRDALDALKKDKKVFYQGSEALSHIKLSEESLLIGIESFAMLDAKQAVFVEHLPKQLMSSCAVYT